MRRISAIESLQKLIGCFLHVTFVTSLEAPDLLTPQAIWRCFCSLDETAFCNRQGSG
jgi:hypothetical protein